MRILIIFLLLFSSLAWGETPEELSVITVDGSVYECKKIHFAVAEKQIDDYGYINYTIGKRTKGFSFNGAIVKVNYDEDVRIDPPDAHGIRKVTIKRGSNETK